jgi:aerobic C4-dicarboxylate transport protein
LAKTEAAAPERRLPFYRQLYVQVLAAIALGALLGHFNPELGASLKPLGDAFIKLVKMIIAPVIFLTLATGIAGMRELGEVGRVAAKAFVYFLFFSTLALVLGLIVANIVQPGAGMHIDPATLDPPRPMSRASPASCSPSSRRHCSPPSPRAKSSRFCSSPSSSASPCRWWGSALRR